MINNFHSFANIIYEWSLIFIKATSNLYQYVIFSNNPDRYSFTLILSISIFLGYAYSIHNDLVID